MFKRKRQARRRPRRAGKRKSHAFYKTKDPKGQLMTNRTRASLHNVVAPRYHTRLECGFTGSITPVTGTPSYCNLAYTNTLEFPFDTGMNVTHATPGLVGVLYPATLAIGALNTTGHSQLSVLYASYRVYASKIHVTYTPGTVPQMLVLWPSETGVSLGIDGDMQKGMSQPYAKAITCSPTNNIKQNTLSVYMDNPTLRGQTRRQYDDDLDNAGLQGSIPPIQPVWNLQVAGFSTGSITSTGNAIEVRIEYWVEYFDPLPPTDI